MWRPTIAQWCALALALLAVVPAAAAALACSEEFDTCAMPRDCCEGTSCVGGDWAVTTDSTCLSDRSVALNALAMGEKVEMVQRFYARADNVSKTAEEVTAIVGKYEPMFAKLVSRLERKYGMSVDGEKEL